MLLKFLLAAVIFSSSCFAAMADWDVAEFSRTRLVFDFNDKAGIHIKMQPGWKTYWRKPGDGGIAPHFDWSGSGNVKTVSVLYPVPHRFEDGYSTSIGYEKEVVFPLLVEPEEPGRPVELQLNVSYAICGKLCVPVVSRLRGTPNSGTYKDHNTLEHFTRLLPKQLLSPPSELKIKSVLDGKSPYLRIDAPKTADDIFVEAPAGFYIPVSKKMEDGSFLIDLTHSENPQKLKGETLKITMISGKMGREFTWKIR